MNQMCQNVIFTICAKNYLAQALTLKESVIKNNKNIDFYIFLSDNNDAKSLPSDLVLLDNNWVPNWQLMAFKYDVVEFSTAIKPYAIQKLFNDGYQKVSYIDPDIFVVNKLDYVFEQLEHYSAILTPHRCTMIKDGEFIDEHGIILNGVFNLGFFAVKNNSIGESIVTWWIGKLCNQCYMDLWNGLAVDQKWMEFIPAYYPKDVLISSHLGMNAAIWNIQERQLVIDNNGNYIIQNKQLEVEKYDLLFWHFSGYSPLKKNQLLKNNPETNFDKIPELLKLGKAYGNAVIKNGYEQYSKMKYAFNYFDNGNVVLPIHRRLFRHYYVMLSSKGNPFEHEGFVYQTLKKNKLLSNDNSVKQDPRRDQNSISNISSKKKLVHVFLRILKSMIGINKYMMVIKAFDKFGKVDSHYFLIKDLE